MGYRGEDVPGNREDRGRQMPWQPSSGPAPGNTGAWDGGSRGYPGSENYPPADGNGGFGYGPDDGYPGQGQQGYGPQDGQYGSPYEQQPYQQQRYEQQPYEQYDGYGPGTAQGDAGGYGGPSGYGQHDGYGYDRGQRPAPGYDQNPGYDQAGYDQRPAPGYDPGRGYQDPSGGYGQPQAYPAPPAGSGGYPAPRGRSGSYPALTIGHGGQDGYSAEDAGNDWYGGQPAAANGASFADTGSYRLNGLVADEYGTGPRGAVRDPVRGYPSGPAQQGTSQLPVPLHPAASGGQAFPRTGSAPVAETRQQQRLDDSTVYQDYGQDTPDGYNDYQDRHSDYQDGFDGFEANGDPHQDPYGDGTGSHAAGGGGRGSGKAPGRSAALGPLRGKRLLYAALAVVAVGIIGVAAYVFVLKPNSPASNATAQGPLPTSGAQPSQQACVKQLGTYCHIESATDDPKPLTTAELFPPAVSDQADKTSYSLVSTKVDKTCGNAVIGSALITALKAGTCTQVLRASYVSGNSKIMGTIGVINLATTNGAHHAGKVVGQNDFVAPLTSAKGVASKLGNGTGVVEAEFKGHYLILTWSEFVDGTKPSTKAQDNQLEQFSSDLVGETANIDLSQRMVTGVPATPGSA